MKSMMGKEVASEMQSMMDTATKIKSVREVANEMKSSLEHQLK